MTTANITCCTICANPLSPGVRGTCTPCIKRQAAGAARQAASFESGPRVTTRVVVQDTEATRTKLQRNLEVIEDLRRALGMANDEITRLKQEIRSLRVRSIEAEIQTAHVPSRATHRTHAQDHRVSPHRRPFGEAYDSDR